MGLTSTKCIQEVDSGHYKRRLTRYKSKPGQVLNCNEIHIFEGFNELIGSGSEVPANIYTNR